MKPFLFVVLLLGMALGGTAWAEDSVLVGASDHQFMGYITTSTSTLPTYFMWAGIPILEVSPTGVVIRYKKNGVWVTAP